MLGSFERLRVGNALTLTEETLRSGHRLEFTYILGTFCERISKKCGHARLSAKILHNQLSLRSRSLRPSVKRRTLAASISFTRCGARFQLSTPHSAQLRANIDRIALGVIRHIRPCGHWPCAALEVMENRIWYEPSARCIHVPVSVALLLIGEETLRENKMQMILSARHRNVE